MNGENVAEAESETPDPHPFCSVVTTVCLYTPKLLTLEPDNRMELKKNTQTVLTLLPLTPNL